ncbi:MAG: transposase [Verrucomicrobiales bacterium]|jgi:REP element-mobilizing transposase RayT|nr:transposase [Verrucomicrobiales bacterium]
MRTPRIKVSPQEGAALYHCISRTVNGEHLFADADREQFRLQMWRVAEFCGVEIITYAVLSNHFHMLVRVPEQVTVSDAELLRRYKILHPQPNKYQTAKLEALAQKLAADGDADATRWRRQQLALMGDVSQFMKLLKQRFTVWFNRRYERYGTIWSERFKSVLVETGRAARVTAAYIDLNPVRAGLAKDPKDYRYCGYAEAVAGGAKLRAALTVLFEQREWRTAHDGYRQILFGAGYRKKNNAASLSAERVSRVIASGGALSAAEWLRCRWKWLTNGAVLGSKEFVSLHAQRYRRLARLRRDQRPRALPAAADGDGAGLAVLRGCR